MGAEVYHQLIMLKTMQAGVGGYARLQSEAGRQLVQINLRGLGAGGGLRAFWYAGDGLVRELGTGAANPWGEAGLYTQLPADSMTPGRLTALLVTDTGSRPRPLAIGLCTAQSAGSLTDAKNVLLALCERLSREAPETGARGAADAARAEGKREASEGAQAQGGGAEGKSAGEEKKTAVPEACGDAQKPAGGKQEKENAADIPAGRDREERAAAAPKAKPGAAKPPREVFLPAIDVRQERRRSRRAAVEEQGGQTEAVHGCREAAGGGGAGAVGAVGAACASGAAGAVYAAGAAGSAGAVGTVGAVGTACASGAAGAAGAARATAAAGGAVMQQPAVPEKPRPLPRRSPAALPADRLPRLCWPVPFQTLAACFERCLPVRLMDWSGWRFVQVQTGGHPLWIGRLCREDRIASIAYVLPADVPAPAGMPFCRARNAAGENVQALVLKGERG